MDAIYGNAIVEHMFFILRISRLGVRVPPGAPVSTLRDPGAPVSTLRDPGAQKTPLKIGVSGVRHTPLTPIFGIFFNELRKFY